MLGLGDGHSAADTQVAEKLELKSIPKSESTILKQHAFTKYGFNSGQFDIPFPRGGWPCMPCMLASTGAQPTGPGPVKYAHKMEKEINLQTTKTQPWKFYFNKKHINAGVKNIINKGHKTQIENEVLNLNNGTE